MEYYAAAWILVEILNNCGNF